MDDLKKAAQIAIHNCLRVQKGETVLIITDEPLRKIGYILWEAAGEANGEAILTEIVPRSSNGAEPPAAVAAAMKEVDVVIIPTSKSMTHTTSRREACAAGARCASLPGIREDTMRRALNADYDAIARLSHKLADILTNGATAHVTSPAGTNLIMSLVGVKGRANTGLIHHPGEYGNLPGGEAYVAPVEGSANGVIVIDGAIADSGILSDIIRIIVKDGYAERILGGEPAIHLEELIEPFGRPGRNIAELGIGTNEKAHLIGSILEDEKVLGTVHIALGDNVSMGGKVSVPSHLDGILLEPTVKIDGEIIVENGTLRI